MILESIFDLEVRLCLSNLVSVRIEPLKVIYDVIKLDFTVPLLSLVFIDIDLSSHPYDHLHCT